jgi:hypothetical protein
MRAPESAAGGAPRLHNASVGRRPSLVLKVVCLLLIVSTTAAAGPLFVNALLVPGSMLDGTRAPGAAAGRFGQFSDLYYDPARREWWALSDRGPGGGRLDYHVRLHRIDLRVDPVSGRIFGFRIAKTVLLEDPGHRLEPGAARKSARALTGLNPLDLNRNRAGPGRSLDPEGLVIDPRTGHFLVSDEYGPSVYEFNRRGVLVGAFATPDEVLPWTAGVLDCDAGPDRAASGRGRQDNRGFEGLAISPDGTRVFAALQDPLIDEGPRTDLAEATHSDDGDGRNVRIVVFDNDSTSPSYRRSIAQYVYQLEPQVAVRNRILAAGGVATATNPRQGHDIGVSAIAALNAHAFLVLERDNRGMGVSNPAGRGAPDTPGPTLAVSGSKRIFRIELEGATDVTGISLPRDGDLATVGIRPVVKDDTDVFIDLGAHSVLPHGNQAEKWEGLTIGPRLRGGGYVIVAGTDNDYSVSQSRSGELFDLYVDFLGNFATCAIDSRSRCEVNPPASGPLMNHPVRLPEGFTLLPGVLHAYRASSQDLAGYVPPDQWMLDVHEFTAARPPGRRLGQRHAR